MLVYDIFPPKKIRKIIKEEVCGIKPYKTKKGKYFNIGSRIFIAIGIIFIIVFSFAGFSFEAIGEEKLRVELYSSKCAGDAEDYEEIARAGWQNIENTEGKPDVLQDGSIESFFEGNSAVYKGGASSIICQEFRRTQIDPEGHFDKLSTYGAGTDENTDIHRSFQSAKIYFSFALDEVESEPLSRAVLDSKVLDSKSNNKEYGENISGGSSVRQQPEPQAIVGESNVSDSLVSNIDTKIIIWRSLDGGETWHLLDKISTSPLSNALNNGY
ncbi:hypothetical protein AMJ49_05320, partial [Parcubacteria bacterium DG_74_2]